MPNKTISVQERDLPIWARAERAAAARRTSVSGLVLNALAAFLGDDDNEMRDITIRGEGSETRTFRGRWLIDADLDSDVTAFDYPAHDPAYGHVRRSEDGGLVADVEQWRWGLALTQHDRVVLYGHHWSYDPDAGAPTFKYFDTVDEAEKWFDMFAGKFRRVISWKWDDIRKMTGQYREFLDI